ncbi:MAG: 2-oxo-4-hydroxy-4-carboxy-5-ureidoimidazoline decarboxylase [Hydrococcus sp. Prado102]|jgi:2-oxo-4-hydroxy-4-carboxy-5-ureidoimidazoline decarboxylase|nr:2-oxo-4-hydroxy-4-carboxy-5-ureidoimidazoline decarboxylase [Hydrococcus sp. Prado102]
MLPQSKIQNPKSKITIDELNRMSEEAFVAVLGAVFEDTPAIAQKAWYNKPFADVAQLHQSMVSVVRNLNADEQLALIKAHPDLGSKAKMAQASVKEQAGAGLDKLTLDECDRFLTLNQAYQEKFGFPFIIAVKNLAIIDILDAFERRLQNSIEVERQQALEEIFAIALFRLLELLID